jgi:putrescine importer
VHYGFRSRERVFLARTIPILGFLVCGFIWLNLNHSAQILGTAWIAVGLVVYLLMRNNKARSGSEQELIP